MSHVGTDGSRMYDRIERYGAWDGYIGENIVYGEAGDEYMLFLYVDDGNREKKSRNIIMSENFLFTGIA